MTTALDTQKPRSQELLHRMADAGGGLYREAAQRGMSLSAFLEREDPSEGYKDDLDAFGRLMKVAKIATRSNPAAGFHADRLEAFDKSDQTRALFPEWAMRQWRRAATGRDVSTRAYGSDDQALGSVMRPYADAAAARYKQIAPAVPLSELVAITTGIDSDSYRAFYLTDTTSQERFVRVGEGADLPRAKLTGGDRTIRLYKYGRLLETTYEVMRRQPIDMVALHIARMAVQAETDKVATVLDVLVSGDGNSGTAATSYNLTALDGAAVAGTLTLKGWLAFKLKLANPYMVTTALAQEAVALQMMLLNVGSANLPLVTLPGAVRGGFRPVNTNLAEDVALGITADAPTLKVVALDRRFAIERVYEIGADIQEIVKWVERQTTGLAMSETEGYDTFDQNAAIILDVNA